MHHAMGNRASIFSLLLRSVCEPAGVASSTGILPNFSGTVGTNSRISLPLSLRNCSRKMKDSKTRRTRDIVSYYSSRSSRLGMIGSILHAAFRMLNFRKFEERSPSSTSVLRTYRIKNTRAVERFYIRFYLR